MYKGIALILISFIVPIVIGYFRYNNKNQNKPNLLYYPKFYIIFVVLSFIFMSLAIFLGDFEPRHWPICAGMLIIFILGLYMMLLCLNYKVEFQNDFIEYKNLFGKKYIFEYRQITELRIYYSLKTGEMEKYLIITNKKKIEINYMMINFSDSLLNLKRMLKKSKHLHKIEINEINKKL